MTELRLYFPFEPKPVQSSTFSTKNGVIRNYQPKKVTSYKGVIAYSFIQQVGAGFIPTDKPIFITRLWFVFATNKGISKKDMAMVEAWEASVSKGFMLMPDYEMPAPLYKPTRPDLADNLSKGVMDALTGLLWKDDSQIVEMSGVMKCFGLRPRIEMWLEYDK